MASQMGSMTLDPNYSKRDVAGVNHWLFAVVPSGDYLMRVLVILKRSTPEQAPIVCATRIPLLFRNRVINSDLPAEWARFCQLVRVFLKRESPAGRQGPCRGIGYWLSAGLVSRISFQRNTLACI